MAACHPQVLMNPGSAGGLIRPSPACMCCATAVPASARLPAFLMLCPSYASLGPSRGAPENENFNYNEFQKIRPSFPQRRTSRASARSRRPPCTAAWRARGTPSCRSRPRPTSSTCCCRRAHLPPQLPPPAVVHGWPRCSAQPSPMPWARTPRAAPAAGLAARPSAPPTWIQSACPPHAGARMPRRSAARMRADLFSTSHGPAPALLAGH